MEIRWYYSVLRHSFVLIVASVLIPAIIAFLVSMAMSPTYRAQADLVLYKNKINLNFDPRFQTISEDDLIRLSGQDPRRQTMAALAVSDQVLNDTLAILPEKWQANWSLERLTEVASVETTGNLLRLSIRAHDAQEAADLTNSWTKTFARIANNSFSLQPDNLTTLLDLQATAQAEYDQAQKVLEEFIEVNQIDELALRSSTLRQSIDNLQDTYLSIARTELITSLSARQQLPLLLHQAQALRARLLRSPMNEPADFSTRLAVVLIVANTFNNAQIVPDRSQLASPEEIQFALPSLSETPLTVAQTLDLLDQTIATLRELQSRLDQTATRQGYDMLTSPALTETHADQILTLQAELGRLQSRLEVENATMRELTEERSRTWEELKTITDKVSEAKIALNTAETEVVIATHAIPNPKPVGPRKVLNTLIGASLGLAFGLAVAFIRAHLDESFTPPSQME